MPISVVQRFDHGRNRSQAGPLRRAPAPFAGDDLELVGLVRRGTHQDRLQHALIADRSRQGFQIGLVEMTARLIGIAMQQFDGQLALARRRASGRSRVRARLGGRVGLAQQSRQSTPQSPASFNHGRLHRLYAACAWRARSRFTTSRASFR
jgi:hypothetical protein